MRKVLDGKGMRVSKPTKTAELRILGLDDSATPAELTAALAKVGSCPEGDIKIGDIRKFPSGLEATWARFSSFAAKRVADAGIIQMGWVSARVVVSSTPPLTVFPLSCDRAHQAAVHCGDGPRRPLLPVRHRGPQGGHMLGAAQVSIMLRAGPPSGTPFREQGMRPPGNRRERGSKGPGPLPKQLQTAAGRRRQLGRRQLPPSRRR